MIAIREATENDVSAIGEIFTAAYGEHYAHPEFYDPRLLKKLIFDDDTLILVAEDTGSGALLGTGSVILDLGAFGDLLGEFGRLVVHPDGRRLGIGKKLMAERIDAVEDRLHIAVVENRTVHPYSQKISAASGFACAGFLPSKLLFEKRENIAYYIRHFGPALQLRRNNPRVLPETYELADHVLRSCGLPGDAIADADSPAYHDPGGYRLEEMTSRGYASLLHFERGRIADREIFGPVKLHVGLFQLQVSNYRYLLARRNGHLVGGIGFHIDHTENAARLLELVSADEGPVRALLAEVTRLCREDEGVEYIEADINAHAPRMQRTLLELGYLPGAYIPAMAFHRVERLDAVRMVRLLAPLDTSGMQLHDASAPVAEAVIRLFREREVAPRLAELAPATALFRGLDAGQTAQLASVCSLRSFPSGTVLTEQGTPAGEALLVLAGRVSVSIDGKPVGIVGPGESLGELSLLRATPHAATATATEDIEAAVLERDTLQALVRRRPDIGLVLYRNLATQLGEKLLRTDRELMR
ncbi:MAG: cyclic nucleotide-binding domain-containing protein [Akkermansiaceae bacterium]|nr:cyclic nucleotide-binding domain-containing protein [Akkermansiaceae bacterium]